VGAGGAFVFTVVCRLLAKEFPADPRIKEIVGSWAFSNLFICINSVVYVALYQQIFGRSLASLKVKREWFWLGFGKDMIIYTFAGLFMVNGLLRYRQVLPYMALADRWRSYAIFAIIAIFLATMGIMMDLRYVHGYSPRHSLNEEYKNKEACTIMRRHIYLRFVCVFSAPLMAWFAYLLVCVARAA
jgi:hypothetical protein